MTASRYRVRLIAADGSTIAREITQEDWDTLVDEYLDRRSPYVAAIRERLRTRDHSWRPESGWDDRPESQPAPAPELTEAERHELRQARMREEHAATVAAFEARERRENRRSYYLRTGK